VEKIDYGDPADWPGLLPGFQNIANEEERDLAALDPAWGKAAVFFRTGHRPGHAPTSMRCQSLEAVHHQLSVFKARFASGDTLSLLQAASMCGEENLPMPTWLAVALKESLDAFLRPGKATSLDEVFTSRNLPTGSAKRAAAARQDWQLGGLLYHRAYEIAQGDETILSLDAAVERLLASAEFGVGKTKAKSLIATIGKNQSQFLGRDVTLSGFLTKRRKRMTA